MKEKNIGMSTGKKNVKYSRKRCTFPVKHCIIIIELAL